MKTIIQYQCEICKQQYDAEQQALKCESRGWFNSNEYPKGLMYEYIHHGYVGIFAIPKDVQPTTGGFNKGHLGETSFWACRVNGGDTLGNQLCGHDYLRSGEISDWKRFHYISKDKVGCEEYNRMVAFLKSQDIQPSYYDEQGQLVIVK